MNKQDVIFSAKDAFLSNYREQQFNSENTSLQFSVEKTPLDIKRCGNDVWRKNIATATKHCFFTFYFCTVYSMNIVI